RADEGVREPRMAAPSGGVGRELRGSPPEEAALALDRAADGRESLRVEGGRALSPVGCGLGAVREEDARVLRVAREHVDLAFERRVAELREPEAALLDEVDRQPVVPRR